MTVPFMNNHFILKSFKGYNHLKILNYKKTSNFFDFRNCSSGFFLQES